MVVVLGSVNLDFITSVSSFPRPGETVTAVSFSTSAGGKGGNQALAARRAGAPVALYSAVGADAFAETALTHLRRDGVQLDSVTVADCGTGLAMVSVDAHGENTISVVPGANTSIGPQHIKQALRHIKPAETLLLQQEIPASTLRECLEQAAARPNLRSILNIAPFLPETRDLAHLASIVVANESEFATLTEEWPGTLTERISEMATRNGQTVVVTLGKNGVVFCEGGMVTHEPATKVNIVDTVGAGDTFCGYLAATLEAGADFTEAIARAVQAAGMACGRSGAQPAIPRATELN